MSFVGRFICIEKFNLCLSCCPLKRRHPLFGLSTNGGFTVDTCAIYPSPWRHQCRVSPGHIHVHVAGTLISSHTNTSCIHLVIQRPVMTNTMIRHQLYNTQGSQTNFESQTVWQMKIRADRVSIKLEVCPHKKTKLPKYMFHAFWQFTQFQNCVVHAKLRAQFRNCVPSTQFGNRINYIFSAFWACIPAAASVACIVLK